ncbi:MAG: hypothetical protein RL226_2095 [Bacteroidota bacterium]|jgi:SM-20-related protein
MEEQFEVLIEGVMDQGFGVVDNFLDPALVTGLRNNLTSFFEGDDMERAGIGKLGMHRTDVQVRGDSIRWLENHSQDPFELRWFQVLQSFVDYLNRTCFTSINASEFHYAAYPPGTYYQRHLDQFSIDSGRRFSLIVYLNEGWTDQDGGELALYLPDRVEKVAPMGGRAVFFRSDVLEHEVLIAHRQRHSLTGWLKSI